MSQEFDIAILGATGAVGEAMVEVLEERQFPVRNLYLLASDRSAGKVLRFKGKSARATDVEDFDWSQVQIALFSAGAEASERWLLSQLMKVLLLLITHHVSATTTMFLWLFLK